MAVSWGRPTSAANRAPSGARTLLTIILPAIVCGLVLLIITPSKTSTGADDLGIYQLIFIMTLLALGARLGGGLLFTLTVMPIFMVIGGLKTKPAAPTVSQAIGQDYTRGSEIAGGLLLLDIAQFIPMTLLWGHLGLRILAIAWFALSIVAIPFLIHANNKSVAAAVKTVS